MKEIYTLDPLLSPEENLKKLVNSTFKTEIALDILMGFPPNYSNLVINNVHFEFQMFSNGQRVINSLKIGCLQLEIYLKYTLPRKRNTRKRTIKIIDQKISPKYLRQVFIAFKDLKENTDKEYEIKLDIAKRMHEKIAEIRKQCKIEYPNTNLYSRGDNVFQLEFNKLTERKVILIMNHWNQIKDSII